MIRVEHLVKSYGQATVLNDVSAFFEGNLIHGLVGRNGSGKTMLLRCICGLISPSSGTIEVNKKTVNDAHIPSDVGAIIDMPGFLPYYSGWRNLRLLASIRAKADAERIVTAMRLVGLDPKSRKWVCKYSMGMRQRLGIAQAIMEDPALLILDEPMNGLDNTGVRDMRKLLKALRREGKTILLASHNASDIESLCDTVHELDTGRIFDLT